EWSNLVVMRVKLVNPAGLEQGKRTGKRLRFRPAHAVPCHSYGMADVPIVVERDWMIWIRDVKKPGDQKARNTGMKVRVRCRLQVSLISHG
ncbi:unnamed protein product, partial [marine sediment metagenome]